MIAAFEITPRSPGRPHFQPEPDPAPAREPMFNAPWPALVLAVVIVCAYAVQSRFAVDYVAYTYGFSAHALEEGRWPTLFYALFLHGSWAHALMNAAFALAFGTPLARFLGVKAKGAVLFYLFYVVCGVLASLAFAGVHPGSAEPLVGASGAVSGLMGAAARLIGGRGYDMGKIFSRPVLGMGAAWVVVNIVGGVLGASLMPGANGAGIAWEAHLAGFAAGVLLAGPLAWAAWRR